MEGRNVAHSAGERMEEFFPTGAIAFFVSLLLFFVVVWLLMYGIMLYRQNAF